MINNAARPAADRPDQGAAPRARHRNGLRHAQRAHPGQYAVAGQQLRGLHQGGRGRPRRNPPQHAAGDGPARRRHHAARREDQRADLWLARHVDRPDQPRGGAVPRLYRGRSFDHHHHASHRGDQGPHGRAAVLRRDAEAARRDWTRKTRSWSPTWSPPRSRLGGIQRVLQNLLDERVSIRDLPTILEGIAEACGHSPQRHGHHRACAHPPGAADQRRQYRRRRVSSRWSRFRRNGSRPSSNRCRARARTASWSWRRAACRNSSPRRARPSNVSPCRAKRRCC